MKKINKIFTLLLGLYFLNSCGTISEAGKVLRNEKIKTTDEFLVKKREPLVLPPDYNTMPAPGSLNKPKKSEGINKILKIPKNKSSAQSGATSVEQSILNKIGK